MSFLAPVWLLLGAAAAVPVLLHLLRRRIGARVEFPAARYLARAEQEHSRQLRLRNLLLMVLRIVIVVCLALAAARPVARLIGAGHAPVALAIVLDNSLSTTAVEGGRPVFTRLRDAAADVLARSTSTDRLWLVTADGKVAGGAPAAVREALTRVRPLAAAGDLPAAAARAAALVRGAGDLEHVVAIATDGQRAAWTRDVSIGDARAVLLAPSTAPPLNRAVTRAEARPPRWTPEGAVTADVYSPRDSAAWRVTLGGATLARGTVPPDSMAATPIEIHSSPAVRGWVAGTVELEPDELRGDDTRHFAVWVGPPPAATADPSAGAFAGGALDALIQSRRAVAGSGIAIVGADRLTRTPALILAPADPVRAGAANRALERAGLPWRFGAVRRGTTAIRGDRMDGVRATLRYELTLAGAALTDTLAHAGADPWVVAGPGYVLLASPLDPSATDLPLHAAFVPWLGDLLAQRLMTGDAAGQVIRSAPGARLAHPGDGVDALERPDGSHLPLIAGDITAPDEPGVWFLLRGPRRAGALVVDPEPEESNLARLGGAALAARFAAREVRALDDPARWRTEVMVSSGRRPVAVPLLVLALLALAAESVLTRSGAGGRRERLEAAA